MMRQGPAQANDGDVELVAAGPVQPQQANEDDGEIIVAPPPAQAPGLEPAPAMRWGVMSVTANLAQLLPTGTVLVYETLSPWFTNSDKCTTTDRVATSVLLGVLSLICLFFSFTDSVIGRRDGKLYYGIALRGGFKVLNFADEEERREWANLGEFRELRIRWYDFVHAGFTVVGFLMVAFGDVALQKCLLPHAGENIQKLLRELLLGMALLSGVVFAIFPNQRKGIGFNDTTTRRTQHFLN